MSWPLLRFPSIKMKLTFLYSISKTVFHASFRFLYSGVQRSPSHRWKTKKVNRENWKLHSKKTYSKNNALKVSCIQQQWRQTCPRPMENSTWFPSLHFSSLILLSSFVFWRLSLIVSTWLSIVPRTIYFLVSSSEK